MKNLKLAFIFSAVTLLSGCQTVDDFLAENFKQPENKPVKVVKTHSPEYEKYTYSNNRKTKSQNKAQATNKTVTKRINTTQCHDSDDWYLDGYRVGKSFSSQSHQMYQQRLNYCGYSTASLPATFKNNWQRGFKRGIR